MGLWACLPCPLKANRDIWFGLRWPGHLILCGLRLKGGPENGMAEKVKKTEEEWQKQLSPEQYYVTRKAGTEPAFTGKYWKTKDSGTYACVCCGQPLFSSETKFESGTGWPSFWQPVDGAAVLNHTDQSYGIVRTE